MRDEKVKEFSARAWTIISTRTRIGLLPAVSEITCTPTVAERLLEATRQHRDMVNTVWKEQLEMYLMKPTLLFGLATDRNFGPYSSSGSCCASSTSATTDMPKQYPRPADSIIKCNLAPEVIKGITTDILHYVNAIGRERLKKFWQEQQLGPGRLAR